MNNSIPIDKPLSPAELRKYDPHLPVNWRWLRVRELCDSVEPSRPTKFDDACVRQARHFLLALRSRTTQYGRQQLMYKYPGLYLAFQLWQARDDAVSIVGKKEVPFVLEARLLTGESWSHIADNLGLLESTVYWYSKLFFDVTERLHQKDWITAKVLVPAVMNASVSLRQVRQGNRDWRELTRSEWSEIVGASIVDPYFDVSLKFFAYFGGSVLLDIMLTGFKYGNKLTDVNKAESWLDEAFRLGVARRSAQAISLTSISNYRAMELFNVHTRLIEISERRALRQDEKETSSDAVQVQYFSAVSKALESLHWRSGPDVVNLTETQHRLDSSTANLNVQLRDDELINVAQGGQIDNDVKMLHFDQLAKKLDDSSPPELNISK